MKLEIEITEEEIKSAMERKVRAAIADQTNAYRTDEYIKERVKEHWKNAADAMVQEILKDSAVLREKIRAEVERKLRIQVAAAIKAASA